MFMTSREEIQASIKRFERDLEHNRRAALGTEDFYVSKGEIAATEKRIKSRIAALMVLLEKARPCAI